MKRLCAILGVLVLALFSVGTAAAEESEAPGRPPASPPRSGQGAGGCGGAYQGGATNARRPSAF